MSSVLILTGVVSDRAGAPSLIGLICLAADISNLVTQRFGPALLCSRSLVKPTIKETDHQGLYRDFEPISQPTLSAEHLQRLQEARTNLEDASELSPILGLVYRTVLGRLLFCLGKFDLATKKYEQAESDHYFFSDSESASREDYRWEISFCAALCHKLGGDFQQAVSILEALGSSEVAHVLEALGFSSEADLLEELGSSREGSAWWIAKWYTERGQFTEAAQWLRTEMQSRYAPKETWDLSVALAFAEFADTDLQADAFDRRLRIGNTGLHEIVVGLSKQFCPELDVLSEGS